MEDVLDVYKRPYDRKRPVVCLDETSKQLIGETRQAVPAAPGRPAREDSEYVRNGVANLFMVFEPLGGKRKVKVTERRTKLDWAECVREVVDGMYPQAQKVVLVMDNLNTHTPASLYQAFEPAEAKRIWDRLELHYTPKHGSWLNVAECEFSVLSRQCTNRRIADEQVLRAEIDAWQRDRNQQAGKVKWQFTTADARIRLAHLYPKIQA
jgi:transposase